MLTLLPELMERAHIERGVLTGASLISLEVISVDELLVLAQHHALQFNLYVRATSHDSVDDLVNLLNAGVYRLFVGPDMASDLIERGVEGSRLVVAVNLEDAEALIDCCIFAGVILPPDDVPAVDKLIDFAEKCTAKAGFLASVFVDHAQDVYSKLPRAIPIITQDLLTVKPKENPDKLAAAKVIWSRLVSDRPDQLVPTIVTDTAGRSLGLCFSSEESLIEVVRTRTGVYQSRKRGLWYKGATSGATQRVLRFEIDCDGDALLFVVEQSGPGFCHNNSYSCFGEAFGLTKLEQTVQERMSEAPEGSYTKRLFNEPKLLQAKIMEEAEELCEAETPNEVAWEAADLLYFATVKLAEHGVSWRDVEVNLEFKHRKVSRRKGDAKPKWINALGLTESQSLRPSATEPVAKAEDNEVTQTRSAPVVEARGPIAMQVVHHQDTTALNRALRRPAQSSTAFDLARPIIQSVRERGDAALLELTHKFDKVQLDSSVMNAPFDKEHMKLDPELKSAIDLAMANVEKFHAAQLTSDLHVETAPGVHCSRFSRPIASVGLYVPGGSAVLPSTAIMLGVPAQVAGCKNIVFASPPRQDGTLSPEVVYVAHKVGASQIVLAGGAQAVAAMAYGTDLVTKCDKILGPGNQFVTAAKMIVQTDLDARVSIDMPAGPSEVLVIADAKANKAFVASDLLSQAEHGPDSQVILMAVDWSSKDVQALQDEIDAQANRLPRREIVRKAIAHSTIIQVESRDRAMALSNQYAPEHLILQVERPRDLLPAVQNAGSVFIGALSPESCGDYTSGTNHTLPTYGYANQYSGVNTGSYLKHITAQELSAKGIKSIGPATYALANREELHGHAYAIKVRMDSL